MADELIALAGERPFAVQLAAVAVIIITALIVLRIWGAKRESKARAEAVLCIHLSDQELFQLKRFHVLDVPSRDRPARVYRIRDKNGKVSVRENGIRMMELCVRPRIDLPGNEHVLAHKLMIQAAEDEYLARANVVWRIGQATVGGRMSWLD